MASLQPSPLGYGRQAGLFGHRFIYSLMLVNAEPFDSLPSADLSGLFVLRLIYSLVLVDANPFDSSATADSLRVI